MKFSYCRLDHIFNDNGGFRMEEKEVIAIIEAILFVAGDAVSLKELSEVLGITDIEMRSWVDRIIDLYNYERRGLQIIQYQDKIQMSSRSEYASYIEKLLHPIQKQSLSQAIMETLAIIAYSQPITKSEVEMIRGVKCDYTLSSLVGKDLIIELGRRDTPGKPILYGTSESFLKHFGFTNISDLPHLQSKKEKNT